MGDIVCPGAWFTVDVQVSAPVMALAKLVSISADGIQVGVTTHEHAELTRVGESAQAVM